MGVGYSDTGRRLGLSSWQLGVQAVTRALEDAGLTSADVDGITVLCNAAGTPPDDYDQVAADDLGYMMGFKPLNFYSEPGASSPAFSAAAMHAYAAVRSGMAHTVVAVRIIRQAKSAAQVIASSAAAAAAGGGAPAGPVLVGGDAQFTMPFGSVSPTMSIGAMPAQRHMDLFGTTVEQFGAHVIAQRDHAALNPEALFRDRLSMEDYLASRMISTPVRILDCDYPVDSASAVIFTAGDRARDARPKPVWVDSAAFSSVKYPSFENLDDMTQSSPWHCARELFARSDLTVDDIDTAHLYDGFTIIVMQWLEALGFCGLGESGPFIEAGNTRLGGRIPVNTDGGACNMGRRHGANFAIEAIRQLRGECGERQVKDAKASVWTNAVGPFSAGMLMTAD